jgi:hypothetical protein
MQLLSTIPDLYDAHTDRLQAEADETALAFEAIRETMADAVTFDDVLEYLVEVSVEKKLQVMARMGRDRCSFGLRLADLFADAVSEIAARRTQAEIDAQSRGHA